MDQLAGHHDTMRRKQRQTSTDRALELLGRAPAHHLATTTPEGHPVLRCLNGVLLSDHLLFHGAIAGEKSTCIGQAAVVSAHEEIAVIPSYFVDAEKACPATTYYRSVQVHGTLINVESTDMKARLLQALMEKLQPEGRHVPLRVDEPLYQADYRAVRVFGLKIETVTGKESLGQDRPPERTRKVVEGLFQRGNAGDVEAIEHILELSPEARPPAWNLPSGVTLRVAPTPADLAEHARLLAREYWRSRTPSDAILRSISRSTAWVGAHDVSGRLVAGARALADGDWAANIYDVVVAPEYRGLGIGRAVMELLLEHPQVKHCARQRLGTADAQEFYRQLGFDDEAHTPPPFPNTVMLRAGAPRP